MAIYFRTDIATIFAAVSEDYIESIYIVIVYSYMSITKGKNFHRIMSLARDKIYNNTVLNRTGETKFKYLKLLVIQKSTKSVKFSRQNN